MTFNKQKPTYFFTCLIILSLLTACGGYSQPTAVNRSASGAAVNEKNRSASSAAVAEKKAAPPIHDQICTIVRNEEIWLREDTHVEKNDEGITINGPYYSVMDLDQDGYLEIVVS